MKVAIIYYSKTGRTEYVANILAQKLREQNINVDLYKLEPYRDYFDKLLHINPRLVYDTLIKKKAKIKKLQGFNPDNYDIIVIGTPIWFNTMTPIVRSFIEEFRGKISKPIICFTTSNLPLDYAGRFKEALKSMGYNIILYFGISRPENEVDKIDKIVNFIKEKLK